MNRTTTNAEIHPLLQDIHQGDQCTISVSSQDNQTGEIIIPLSIDYAIYKENNAELIASGTVIGDLVLESATTQHMHGSYLLKLTLHYKGGDVMNSYYLITVWE